MSLAKLRRRQRTCAYCRAKFTPEVKPGPVPDYCRDACRAAKYRSRKALKRLA